MLTFSYDNFVTQDMKDTQIQKKLRLESPSVLRRCLELYHSYLDKYLEKDVWNFAPPECIEAKEEGLAFSNPLFRFLKNRNKVAVDKGHNELLSKVQEAFQRSLGKDIIGNLDLSIIEQAGFTYKKRQKICKGCSQASIPNCCDQKSASNRTTADLIGGIRLL